jgi:hypothetical protein
LSTVFSKVAPGVVGPCADGDVDSSAGKGPPAALLGDAAAGDIEAADRKLARPDTIMENWRDRSPGTE